MEPIEPRQPERKVESMGGHQSSWDALYQRNQELEKQIVAWKNTAEHAKQGEKRAVANYEILVKQVVDAQEQRQRLVSELADELTTRLQPQFSPELLAKIAAHVEPKPEKQIASPVPVGRVEWAPDFVSAEEAELRERVRCAAIVSSGEGLAETMQKILSGFDPFAK